MFGLFGKKRKIEKLQDEVRDSFDHVKQDFVKVGEWIKHIDGETKASSNDINEIKEQLLAIQGDIIELKDFVAVFGPQISNTLSKQTPTKEGKQNSMSSVQTAVQTAVQTGHLDKLTVMERSIVWALLNSEMNLSYEDLAALLGKDKSTIRGQINTIKKKSEGLIEESLGPNGKKRLFIPENAKSEIIKSVKVKLNTKKTKK